MKKIVAILLTALMVISLTACAGGDKPAEAKTSEAGTTAENVSTESDSKENAPAEVIPEPESDEDTSETIPENEPAGSEPVNESEGAKFLLRIFRLQIRRKVWQSRSLTACLLTFTKLCRSSLIPTLI